jgi:hypothetical protein
MKSWKTLSVLLLWTSLTGCSQWGSRPPGVMSEPGRVSMRPDYQEDSRVEIRDSFVRPKRPRSQMGALGPPVAGAPLVSPNDAGRPQVILRDPEPAFAD